MRYIGGKSLLIQDIVNLITENTKDVKTILDPFSGSNVVSDNFKRLGYKVITNDLLYFSYAISKGSICLNKKPEFKNLNIKNPLDYLNNLTLENTNINIEDCFVYKNYSPNFGSERMYFQNKNAIKIDVIRLTIEKWFKESLINEDEYFYLLAALIQAVPYVSNITGVYGAYLKYWDTRTYNDLKLKEPEIVSNKKRNEAYNLDANALVKNKKVDLIYLDTPYNSRQYLPNYHILETIAKYDNPKINGKTGVREYSKEKSKYCLKNEVKSAYEDLFKNSKTKYFVISYNTEGLLSTEEMTNLCLKYAKKNTFKLIELDYRRYKNKIPNNEPGLKEQLYFFEYENKKYIKSPMNYTGGKYKLLPQIMPLFPEKINKFVDLFAGGLNVSINVDANEIIANDYNHILINMYKEMQKYSYEECCDKIFAIIDKYNLSKNNKDGFMKLREHYNSNKCPIELFVLICYSFNHQIRFNSNYEFNTPFGKGKSSFNVNIQNNLKHFLKKLKNIKLINKNFKNFEINDLTTDDFVYLDPPYLITCAAYNDGKRGFDGWSNIEEQELLNFLDKLNYKGVKFALSNVLFHKNKCNEFLLEWSKKYKINFLNKKYNNCNYQKNNKLEETVEVLITNY